MARPRKQTVDYFPHDTDACDGKTLTIIQSKYGNDGYAFWFKLLQLLGKTSGHYYDFNNPADWEFLLAKTHQNDTEKVKDILGTLVMLGAIDAELYAHGVIWCQKFVDRVADVYDRAVDGVPKRPSFLVNVGNKGVSVDNMGQSARGLNFGGKKEGTVRREGISENEKLPKKCLSLGIDIKGVNVSNQGVSVSKQSVSADKNPEKATETPQIKLKETILKKESISKKENNKISQLPDDTKKLVNELLKLPGWGNNQLAGDVEWLSEFLMDFPGFSVLYLKACRDHHLARPKTKHAKGAWKSRLRNWMTNEAKWGMAESTPALEYNQEEAIKEWDERQKKFIEENSAAD